jgi:glucosyl-3-phosphoglycerate synthase
VTDTDSIRRWLRARTFQHSRYDAAWLARERDCTISVCLPARECAETIGGIVEQLVALKEADAIDEICVVDAGSRDGTAAVARAAGATVCQEADLLAQFGPVRGKGDAMWRALSALSGELVCYVDADTRDFDRHFVVGLLGPLVEFEEISFVKAFYRRPYTVDGVVVPDGGGRVNELLARPALALLHSELAGIRQPLAGEVAARRALLDRIPFTTGYGVEVAMLLDALEAVGLDGIAQVDLGTRQNSHQPLPALSQMAYAVLRVIVERLERQGRLSDLDPLPLIGVDGTAAAPPLEERPPILALK